MLCEHTHTKRQSKKERLILKYYFKIGNEWARRKGCGLVAKRTRRKEGVLGRKRMTFEILEVRGPSVWDGQILETTVGGGGTGDYTPRQEMGRVSKIQGQIHRPLFHFWL